MNEPSRRKTRAGPPNVAPARPGERRIADNSMNELLFFFFFSLYILWSYWVLYACSIIILFSWRSNEPSCVLSLKARCQYQGIKLSCLPRKIRAFKNRIYRFHQLWIVSIPIIFIILKLNMLALAIHACLHCEDRRMLAYNTWAF